MTDDQLPPRVVPSYPRDTVLTLQEAAAACGVSLRTFTDANPPLSYALGPRTPRVVWGALVEWMMKKGKAA